MVNIKGLTNLYEPTQAAKPAAKSEVKSRQTDDDRDSNGKREDQNDQKQRPPMDEEQLDAALRAIQQLKGVKENHLTVTIELKGSIKMAIVKDPEGKIVRRIPESDLWIFLSTDTEQEGKGQLLDRAS